MFQKIIMSIIMILFPISILLLFIHDFYAVSFIVFIVYFFALGAFIYLDTKNFKKAIFFQITPFLYNLFTILVIWVFGLGGEGMHIVPLRIYQTLLLLVLLAPLLSFLVYLISVKKNC